MQGHGASLADHAFFSLSTYASALKVVVSLDSVHFSSFGLGRRKSWIVPSQLVAGLILLFAGGLQVEGSLNVAAVATCFFLLHMLVAVDDIAVDAWAVELLGPQNAAVAPFCNSAGQTVGWFLSYVVMSALDSATFCNDYLRRPLGLAAADDGLLSMQDRMNLFGICIGTIAVAVWLFKTERALPTSLSFSKSEFGSSGSGPIAAIELRSRADAADTQLSDAARMKPSGLLTAYPETARASEEASRLSYGHTSASSPSPCCGLSCCWLPPCSHAASALRLWTLPGRSACSDARLHAADRACGGRLHTAAHHRAGRRLTIRGGQAADGCLLTRLPHPRGC